MDSCTHDEEDESFRQWKAKIEEIKVNTHDEDTKKLLTKLQILISEWENELFDESYLDLFCEEFASIKLNTESIKGKKLL